MRQLSLTSIAIAALLLLGCNNASAPSSDASPRPADSASATSEVAPNALACPSGDFAAFLPTFMNDVNVQKAFIADPLQSDSVDTNAEPEPKPVSRMLARSEITFPVIPDDEQQAKEGLTLTKTEVSATEVTVQLAKADTDYQMSFFFRKEDCWHLYRMKDDSL